MTVSLSLSPSHFSEREKTSIEGQSPAKSLWHYIKQPLSYVSSKTFQISGLASLSIATNLGLLLAQGDNIGLRMFLHGHVNVDTSLWIDSLKCDFKFSVNNPALRTLGYLSYAVFGIPVVTTREGLNSIAPEFRILGSNFTKKFINGSLEEIMYRGLLQNILIPQLSKLLPENYRHLLDNKVSRVALSSLFFALGHVGNLDNQLGVVPQLLSGIILGTAAEMDPTLMVPCFVHAISNFALGIITWRLLYS